MTSWFFVFLETSKKKFVLAPSPELTSQHGVKQQFIAKIIYIIKRCSSTASSGEENGGYEACTLDCTSDCSLYGTKSQYLRFLDFGSTLTIVLSETANNLKLEKLERQQVSSKLVLEL